MCCITLTPCPPFSKGRRMGDGGDERRESRFLRNWKQPLLPFSSDPTSPNTLIFSLFALFCSSSWLARSWWHSARPLCQRQPTIETCPLLPTLTLFSILQHTTVKLTPDTQAHKTTAASHTFGNKKQLTTLIGQKKHVRNLLRQKKNHNRSCRHYWRYQSEFCAG